MKKYLYTLLYLLAIAIIFWGCEKDLPTEAAIEPYTFASLDENGGNWDPVLLSSGAEIAIPAPDAVNSSAYLNELEDLKDVSSSLTSAQKAAVSYWGGNALVRWNEIARELVSKYNLIPAPNPDGTYPAPNAANPAQYPQFPFAHPPYTCRMLAYWSAAQYDAMITAWYHKYQHNRPAPYEVDNVIVPLLPQSGLPSYPSEDAAIAAVSQAVLSAMFPLEKDFLAAKAEEHKNSRLWAGMNVTSDLAAGDSLGRAVAARFLARAANDGMKNAQAPKPVADSIAQAAQARWGWHWENLESPQRPVGLTPLFGKVLPWCVPDIIAVRPIPPPAPGSVEFQRDVEELKDIQDNLTTEQRRIANFWADGLGTYTPPGHWNRIAAEEILKRRYSPLRTARTFAYMNMAIMDAGIACWDAKYYYHYPRPSQAVPGFKTILGIPNFPSYTSGHSMFSAAAATVLGHIFPEGKAQFDAQAEEAALSRIYGGIHFRFDAEEGIETGRLVGNYSVVVAQADGAE